MRETHFLQQFMEFSNIFFYLILFITLYLQVFFLVTFLENKKEFKRSSLKKNPLHRFPTTTILVPCWNEEETLETTIRSLINLNYPKDKLQFKIIDDGSTDGTYALAQKLAQTDPRIEVLQKENGGKHTALNLGLKSVNTELVGCLDADSFVDKNALIEIARVFEDPTVKAVTPAIKISDPKSIIQLVQKAEYNISIFFRKICGLLNAMQVTPGPFSIFRKSVFDELGVYHRAHNTEDMEMALRMNSNHYRIDNAHRAFVYTKGPKTFRDLHKQRVRWTYGFLMNVLDYRKIFMNPRYGHIGIVVLPTGVFAVITIFYFIFTFSYRILTIISDKILEIQTVGWQWSIPFTHFDWFAISTGWATFIWITLLSGAVFIAFYGKKMSEGSWKPSIDILLFLILYGYIEFVWVSRSVYNTALARGKESWR